MSSYDPKNKDNKFKYVTKGGKSFIFARGDLFLEKNKSGKTTINSRNYKCKDVGQKVYTNKKTKFTRLLDTFEKNIGKLVQHHPLSRRQNKIPKRMVNHQQKSSRFISNKHEEYLALLREGGSKAEQKKLLDEVAAHVRGMGDSRTNEPLTEDPNKWMEDPFGLDMARVDTKPKKSKKAKSKKAKSKKAKSKKAKSKKVVNSKMQTRSASTRKR